MYSSKIKTTTPGMFIVLVDQSGSMAEPFEGTQVLKSHFAAYAVNRVINEIIEICTDGSIVKDRCFVSVITYGGNTNKAEKLFLHKASELSKFKETVTINRVQSIMGKETTIPETLRQFVTAKATGGTPMADAFRVAANIAQAFANNHPDSFPPVIINITDGEPTDHTGPSQDAFNEARKEAEKLKSISTKDGQAILMNAHVPDEGSKFLGKIVFPSNSFSISNNQLANFLFDISSTLPNEFIVKSPRAQVSVSPNARAFVFNSDADLLVKFLNFGSEAMLR